MEMGFGGACHGTMGRAAMIVRCRGDDATRFAATRRAGAIHGLRACFVVSSLTLLGGCGAIGGFAGAVAGAVTSIATTNPAVGISVGIAVKAATDQAVKTVTRRFQREEQDAIAAAVRDLGAGESGEWQHARLLGSGSDRGEVRVLRLIETPLARCKELLFSVLDGKGESATSAWFTTTACQQGDQWKWASAEPAVDRWGNLQ